TTAAVREPRGAVMGPSLRVAGAEGDVGDRSGPRVPLVGGLAARSTHRRAVDHTKPSHRSTRGWLRGSPVMGHEPSPGRVPVLDGTPATPSRQRPVGPAAWWA